jgi:pyruvate formate lyase activating enzyme
VSSFKLADYLVPTTIDWPGKCAMIIWFAGCNFKCPFCQNGGIVPLSSGREETVKTVKAAIDENVRWIDGVVFSGGEPTLQRDPLAELARHTKGRKRGVMLDTNGSRPPIVEDLLSQGIIDRVSLDIKAAPERYSEVTGVDWAPKVLETLDLSLKSDAEVEVRTTNRRMRRVLPAAVSARREPPRSRALQGPATTSQGYDEDGQGSKEAR